MSLVSQLEVQHINTINISDDSFHPTDLIHVNWSDNSDGNITEAPSTSGVVCMSTMYSVSLDTNEESADI